MTTEQVCHLSAKWPGKIGQSQNAPANPHRAPPGPKSTPSTSPLLSVAGVKRNACSQPYTSGGTAPWSRLRCFSSRRVTLPLTQLHRDASDTRSSGNELALSLPPTGGSPVCLLHPNAPSNSEGDYECHIPRVKSSHPYYWLARPQFLVTLGVHRPPCHAWDPSTLPLRWSSGSDVRPAPCVLLYTQR